MSIDVDDEIIQDFIVEAGELLEQLDTELVSMEENPGDVDLLNSVFRKFHTIKGGAGFLAIDPLVEVCHQAESVFDVLRRGERTVTAELMDSILRVYDAVQVMFENIGQGITPENVDANLLSTLEKFAHPQTASESHVESKEELIQAGKQNELSHDNVDATAQQATGSSQPDEITDEEFQALLDELHGEGKHATGVHESTEKELKDGPVQNDSVNAVDSKPGKDDITEEEFETLLDELHADGKPIVQPQANNTTDVNSSTPAIKVNDTETKSTDEEISEDEFETLLDKLQDQKKGAFVHLSEETATRAAPTAQKADKKAANSDTTVRVETGTLDRIMNMVGELVLLRNRLTNLDEEIGHEEMSSAVASLDVVTAELQSSVMKTRMQPIKKVFGRFPRVVRDVARSLNKQVVLKTTGEDTDLDKNLVEALSDPLIHLVRNAVDHGIETPEVREAAGKPKLGTINLSAEQEGDHILLKISDDGAGIDANALRRKVVESGLMDADAASRLSDRECYHLIFLPGLSTKKEISDISGRGVGMDVVKSKINQLNGTILIDSERGKGSTLSIKVPLTLAIMPTLMVELGELEQIFALPLVNVNEILDSNQYTLNIVDGQTVLLVRGKPLPIFCLSRWLTKSGGMTEKPTGHVVVVSIGTRHIGLLVDKLLGREEVVIKPLGAMLQGTKGLSGATVTGNGKIALILDLPSLVQGYAHLH